jgi:hypothetical protein
LASRRTEVAAEFAPRGIKFAIRCGVCHIAKLNGELKFLQAKMIFKGDFKMFPLSCDLLMFAVAGAIIALSAAAHSPYAETLVAWGF